MNKYHIDLNEYETDLLEKINFQYKVRDLEYCISASNANASPILDLLNSLEREGKIPRQRLSYWNDPLYNVGRKSHSRKGVFEKNGTTGDDIYRHPHFLPYLHYFLFGANLHDKIISAFEEKVGNPAWVTSGDIAPIGKYGLHLARLHNLDKNYAPEEFFKLSLDMGLSLMIAESVMRAVRKI